mgnify:CR=1 FL=1
MECTEISGCKDGFVMSTGGGCIMRDSNLSILRHGLVIYLRISIDEQYNRVKNRKHRPLLNTEDALTTLERLNNERGAIYADISDIQIDVSNLNRQFLHATVLGFTHPRSGKEIQFTSILPQELEKILKMLRKLSK